MAKTFPKSLVFLLVCSLHSTTGQDDDERVVVETKFGFIRGRVRQTDTGARVNEFLGIPYASAPVGDLRFKISKKPTNFTGTYEADKMPPACLQYSEHPWPWFDLDPGQSEDCLYLNIWAPADTGYWMRPVKFFIHGGGWLEGGSNRMPYYNGFAEAVDTLDENGNSTLDGVVVVTINYRLGALGFLNTMDGDYIGNQALSDISLAYEWVSDNIQYFGGDNGDTYSKTNGNKRHANEEDQRSKYPMTLVGHDSGAMALSFLQSPLNNNHIYHRPATFQVVLDGMSMLTLKALLGVDNTGESSLNNLRLTQILAKKLGCPSARDDPDATMECLKGIDASRIVRCASSLSRGRGPPNVFLPQIWPPYGGDGQPFHNLKYQNFSSSFRNTFASFTSEAGSALLTSAFPKLFGAFGEKDVPLSAHCAKKVARRFLRKFPQNVADELLGDLDTDATTANKDKVVQAFRDAFFKCPMVYLGEYRNYHIHTNGIGVPDPDFYILEKQVNPPYNPFASWMGSVGFNTAQINFPNPDGQITVNNHTYKYTDEQKEQLRVNQNLMKSYMKLEKLPLPEFTTEDPAYSVMYLDGKISEKKTNLHSRNCEILRSYFKYHRDTYLDPFYYEETYWRR